MRLLASIASHSDPAPLERYNREFYDRCWSAGTVVRMPGVSAPDAPHAVTVEIGCGLRPRLPLDSALFVDLSRAACRKLYAAGAAAIQASVHALPFATASVGRVYLFDVIEHVDDDAGVLAEIARIVQPNGLFFVSTPLHRDAWHEFDRVVGHARRYEPQALLDLLGHAGFRLEGFTRFGMRPRSALLTRLAAYYLVHWPRTAFWWQEQVLRRMARRLAPTAMTWAGAGAFLVEAADADGVLTAWRRMPSTS